MKSLLIRVAWMLALLACFRPAGALAAKAPAAPKVTEEGAIGMDYGPFLSTSVLRESEATKTAQKPKAESDDQAKPDLPPGVIALKGITIKLGAGTGAAAVCFDTDRLCLTAGWTGGFLKYANTMLANHKGNGYTTMSGAEVFHQTGPGWGGGANGDDFADPRPQALGPLPPERGKYRGLYVHGDQVVLSYQIAGNDVLELPGLEHEASAAVITRTLRIEGSNSPISLAICEAEGGAGAQSDVMGVAMLRSGASVTAVGGIGLPPGAALHASGNRIWISLAPLSAPAVFKIAICNASPVLLASFDKWIKSSPVPVDPKTLCAGGPAHWAQSLSTTGHLGKAIAPGVPYAQDTIDLPDPNPYKAWMRTTGLDFLPDGRAAVSTFNGDVWIVSGIDDKLDHLTWKRFATGLYQPMGLKVVNGDIYVTGRDQITRLHDLNGDGEADFYEDFNSDGILHPLYNSFAFDLQTDAEGNFYFTRCSHATPPSYPGQGYVFRVSKDGKTMDPIATGLRAANGLGAGPDGRVLVSDNEGNWVPASRINLLRMPSPGEQPDFLGFTPQSHQPTAPADYAKPLLWVPHKMDTSSGGEDYIADDRWGPYKGQWVHTSYGTASLFLLLADESSGRLPGQAQGAIIRLPFTFNTGIMRPRFNPHDGQLYVCGVGGGWQTSGVRDGGLYRIRYTGAPSYLAAGFRVVPHGVRLDFPSPLDPTAAADEQNWGVEQWNYEWSAKYGSKDMSVKNSAKPGHDAVEVKKVTVSEDGRSVTLDLPELAPVMQLLIQCNAKAKDGTAVKEDIYATVNHVPAK